MNSLPPSTNGLHCAGIGGRRVEDSFRVLPRSPAGTEFCSHRSVPLTGVQSVNRVRSGTIRFV